MRSRHKRLPRPRVSATSQNPPDSQIKAALIQHAGWRRSAWMGKPYSMDLRERVVAAVDPGGLSCHRAAAQFGVGVNTAILWVRRFRKTATFPPDPLAGHKPNKISGTH